MSINDKDDIMSSADVARKQQAHEAGRILYNSFNSNATDSGNHQPNGLVSPGYHRPSDGLEPCHSTCGGQRRISTVRRTFCLLILFDLILSFILWVIYTQFLNMGEISKALRTEIVEYHFDSSLFDTVILAFWRFMVLIISYAVVLSQRPWMVAITTFGTCLLLLFKIFYFKFTTHSSNDSAISYIVLLVSFVIAWVETWMLDFKVLPREKKDRERNDTFARPPNERTHLLAGSQHNLPITDQYYSPVNTPIESDSEDVPSDAFHSMPGTRGHSRSASVNLSLGGQEQEYKKQGKEALDAAWILVNDQEDWKLETSREEIGAQVFSKYLPKAGKVFLLKGYVDASAVESFEELWYHIEESPQWNPTVLEMRCLQHIDENIEVSYQLSAEAAGGMVSSRDFVTVQCWEVKENGVIISAGSGTTHPDMPEQKKYVRGDNGPGCWVYKPMSDDRCEVMWMLNTNLKGWLPQYLIDQSLSGVMIDFYKALRERLTYLRQTSVTREPSVNSAIRPMKTIA